LARIFSTSPWRLIVVMVTDSKTMVSWLPWHDYRDKLENRWKHLFEIFKIGAPCSSTFLRLGVWPNLEKDLSRIFSSQPWRQMGCHGYLFWTLAL
jgi:hypothetical protein